jgi:hypothetical protein
MGATVVPVEIDDETADCIWRAAHREIIAASPFAKGANDD